MATQIGGKPLRKCSSELILPGRLMITNKEIINLAEDLSPSMKYSDKEQRLICALHFQDFLNQEPSVTYRTLALYCFSKNLQGELVESVRRCYNAMNNSYPYRLTEEFDDLIEFPPG